MLGPEIIVTDDEIIWPRLRKKWFLARTIIEVIAFCVITGIYFWYLKYIKGVALAEAMSFGSGTALILLGYLVYCAGLYALGNRVASSGGAHIRKELSEKLLRQGMNENILRGSTFVGATFPGRWKWARILDTDDDIGFLRLKDEFLSYVGDGGNFEIEKDRLLSLNRKMNKLFFIYALKWIVVKFRSEEGEGREVLFCSREGKSILQCRKNTNLLFDKLVKWSSSSEQYG
ncbi:MAG: hypothetical protein AMS15_01645 [Planctomycetes bacterium DG_23]|nr:MAG: hypothetical protein AMS15_01645 [Planctomycetes bacterium DG_23]